MYILLAALLAVACSKEARVARPSEPSGEVDRRIVFGVDATKVDAVNSDNLNQFYVLATTGNLDTQQKAWTSLAVKESSGKFCTGMYWPLTDPGYHFFASNAEPTLAGYVAGVDVDCTEDIVAGVLLYPAFERTGSLSLSHVLARIGTVAVNSEKGYTLSDITVTLSNVKTSGRYLLRTMSWSDTGTVASVPLTVGSNDIYLIPGYYPISITATYTKGDYVNTITIDSSVTIHVGKINNLNIKLTNDPAIPIDFSVTLQDWAAKEINMVLS